jgi:hypothetical protein
MSSMKFPRVASEVGIDGAAVATDKGCHIRVLPETYTIPANKQSKAIRGLLA